MPGYHFTIHAYRSWRPDHPRGYTRKGEGYQDPDPEMASDYDEAASQDAVLFDAGTQLDLLRLTRSICAEECWCLEGAGFDPTHMHLAVSWRIRMTWNEVDRRLKNLLALKLNRERG